MESTVKLQQAKLNIMDCHTHLQDFDLCQREIVIKEAIDNGVKYLVCNSTSEQDFELVTELCEKYPNNIIPCFGIHPWYTATVSQNWRAKFEKMLKRYPQGVVGEIGLDWAKKIPKETQKRIFEEQFAHAAGINRPVSIHCVKAHGTMLEIIKKYIKRKPKNAETEPKKAIYCDSNTEKEEDNVMNIHLHSYAGSKDITRELLSLHANVYFSYSLMSLQKEGVYNDIPLDRMVIETDSPYQFYQQIIEEFGIQDKVKQGRICNRNFKEEDWGKKSYCEPIHLHYFIQKLSAIFCQDTNKIAELLFENSLKCFRLIKK